MNVKKLKGVVAGALSVMVCCHAAAEELPAVASATEGVENQHYVFDDDDLLADSTAPHGALLRVRATSVRTLLIRPRVNYIKELLSSVEQL